MPELSDHRSYEAELTQKNGCKPDLVCNHFMCLLSC